MSAFYKVLRRVYAKKFSGRCADCQEMKDDLHYWAVKEELDLPTSYAIYSLCAGKIDASVIQSISLQELNA